MKKGAIGWVLAALVAVTGLAGAASAATASLDVGLYSAYVWRGQVYNEDAVVQPAWTVSKDKGLSLSVWGNFVPSDENNAVFVDAEGNETTDDAENEFSEVDLTVSYDLTLGEESPVAVTIGAVQYVLSHPDGDTREASIKVGTDKVPLSPALAVNYDFDEAEGFYSALSISHEIAIREKLTLGLSGSIGYADDSYNEYYFGVADSAVNDATVSMALAYQVNDAVSVSGTILYTALLDDAIKDGAAVIYGDDSHTVYSAGVSYGF